MSIKIKTSGNPNLKIKSPTTITDITAFEKDVEKARDYILKPHTHFNNCLFHVKDLKAIVKPSTCISITFAHILCEDDKGTTYSTAIAFGEDKNDFLLENNPAVYISVEINKTFKSLNQLNNFKLKWIKHDCLNPISHSLIPPNNNHSNFENWIKQFTGKIPEVFLDSKKQDYVINGICFNKKDLGKLLSLGDSKRVALLPVTMNTKTLGIYKIGNDPVDLKIVSYVLVSVDDNDNLIPFPGPDGKNLPITDVSWPHNWKVPKAIKKP